MCRDKNHGGRRCPHDNSEARRRRYNNASMRKAYGADSPTLERTRVVDGDDVKPVTTVVPPSPEVVIAEARDLAAAETKRLKEEGVLEGVPAQRKIGAMVADVATRKYGAPTSEDIKNELDAIRAQQVQKMEDAEAVNTAVVQKMVEYAREHSLNEGENMDQRSPLSAYFELTEVNKPIDPEHRSKIRHIFTDESVDLANLRLKNAEEMESKTKELFDKRAKAYVSALEDVGVEFHEPGSGLWHVQGTKKVVKALDEGIKYVPASWVEASHVRSQLKSSPLVVKSSKRRAHYSDQTSTVSKKEIPIISSSLEDEGFDPKADVHSREYYEYVEPMPKGGYKIEGADYTHQGYSWTTLPEGKKEWVTRRLEWRTSEEKPRGRGWKQAEIREQKWDPETGMWIEDGLKKSWYREKHQRITTDISRNAEITLPDNDRTKAVAIHEFSHRSETSKPVLYDLGVKFRRSRMEEGEQLVNVSPGARTPELGIGDKFNEIYSGRVYPTGNTEIISTGMEQLFYGSYGGFTSAGGHDDDDYRDFMLGTIATTSR